MVVGFLIGYWEISVENYHSALSRESAEYSHLFSAHVPIVQQLYNLRKKQYDRLKEILICSVFECIWTLTT